MLVLQALIQSFSRAIVQEGLYRDLLITNCQQAKVGGRGVFAKHVVHPERSEKNGVFTQPFQSEEAPDEAPS